MTATVGTLLSGRYRIDARIGTGGMSAVYRAFDTVLERRVAIKQLHRDHAADESQIERFRREARAVAQLNHPHVVGVIDVGSDGGSPYIVFEYVEGETLKDRIRRHGSLEVSEAVAYAIEIARALGAAHERGIVHRDVKPQNVLIDEEGSAKVTDFGIARTLGLEGLTAEGRVLGTTDYVSPEQALGHQVTGQSDIYSLGVVLFEMLTGRVPFSGENQVSVAMKHVREDMPDVQVLRPEVSSTLAAVIDRATAKDLRRRHPTVRELISDLEESLTVEAARSGQATGEATAVLRTLSARSRSRLPVGLRQPRRVIATFSLAAVVGGIALVLLANRVEHGTGAGRGGTPSGLHNVSLGQNRAHDYDPLGDGKEHPDEAKAVLDRIDGTFWSTERYNGGVITKGGSTTGTGVGIYVDAAPRAAARAIKILSASPGWSGKVYGAESGRPPQSLDGWQELATVSDAKRTQVFTLKAGGTSFRYYLVWITQLPPGTDRVKIAEIYLFESR